MTNILLWVLSSIASCIIWTYVQRQLVWHMELIDAVFLIVFYVVFFALGPIGLAMVLTGCLMVWLSKNR